MMKFLLVSAVILLLMFALESASALSVPQRAANLGSLTINVQWTSNLSALPQWWGGGPLNIVRNAKQLVVATSSNYYILDAAEGSHNEVQLFSMLSGSWSPYPPALSQDGVLCPVTFYIDSNDDDGLLAEEKEEFFPPQIFGYDVQQHSGQPTQLWNHSKFTDIEVPVTVRYQDKSYFVVGSVYWITMFEQFSGKEVLRLPTSFPVALRTIPRSYFNDSSTTGVDEAVVYEWGHEQLIITAVQPKPFAMTREDETVIVTKSVPTAAVRWNVTGPAGINYPIQRFMTPSRCVFVSEGHGVTQSYYSLWGLDALDGELEFNTQINLPNSTGSSTKGGSSAQLFVGGFQALDYSGISCYSDVSNRKGFVAVAGLNNGDVQILLYNPELGAPSAQATLSGFLPTPSSQTPLFALCEKKTKIGTDEEQTVALFALLNKNGISVFTIDAVNGAHKQQDPIPLLNGERVDILQCGGLGRVIVSSSSADESQQRMWEVAF